MSRSASPFPMTRVTLLGRMRQMDNSAWSVFMQLYNPVTYRFAKRAGLDDHAADEVVARVLTAIHSAMKGGFELDPQRGRFRDYLRTVVNREIWAYRRRRARNGLQLHDDMPPAEDETALRDWEEIERQEVLNVCIERLRGSMRARDLLAFQRYALNGEPVERVARELQLSRSRLYAIKHEMIQRLRQIRQTIESPEFLG